MWPLEAYPDVLRHNRDSRIDDPIIEVTHLGWEQYGGRYVRGHLACVRCIGLLPEWRGQCNGMTSGVVGAHAYANEPGSLVHQTQLSLNN